MGGSSKRLDSSLKVSLCALPSPITDGCGGEGVPASPAGGSTKHGQEPRLDPNPPPVFEPSDQSVTLYAKATGRAVVLGAPILEAGDGCASEDAVDSLATTLASCL